MPNFIKVKDVAGNIHIIETVENTLLKTADQLARIAANALGAAASTLTILDHGKKGEKK